MRIYAISDLHLDLQPTIDLSVLVDGWPFADVLVLAGDIAVVSEPQSQAILHTLFTLCVAKYSNVVFVSGNHEYFHCHCRQSDVDHVLHHLCQNTGVHYLQRSSVVLEGVEFIGCTLWSLLEKRDSDALTDFRANVFPHRIAYVEAFVRDLQFLRHQLAQPSALPRVVVTHHLPSSRLLWDDGGANSGFATDILDQLELHGVKHWFCGHSHRTTDSTYGDTVLSVNPLGYPKEVRTRPTKNQYRRVPI